MFQSVSKTLFYPNDFHMYELGFEIQLIQMKTFANRVPDLNSKLINVQTVINNFFYRKIESIAIAEGFQTSFN